MSCSVNSSPLQPYELKLSKKSEIYTTVSNSLQHQSLYIHTFATVGSSRNERRKKMSHLCPVCGTSENVCCDDDLGEVGMFFSCRVTGGGCGSTFRITSDGHYHDIF